MLAHGFKVVQDFVHAEYLGAPNHIATVGLIAFIPNSEGPQSSPILTASGVVQEKNNNPLGTEPKVQLLSLCGFEPGGLVR